MATLDNLAPTQTAAIAYKATVGTLPIGGASENWSIDFSPSVEYEDPSNPGTWVAA